MSQYDVCVIGAGPGGYVAAIRSAQLGLKTAIIEREYMGGVCLNVGCIPSKALISAAHFYHRLIHDSSEMGIKVAGEVTVDFKQLQKWKQSVCSKMAGGVSQLLKGNGVEILNGEATFTSAKELSVKSSAGTTKVSAKNFVVATGSRPIAIPGFEYDEKFVLSSTGGLDLQDPPKALVVIGGGYIGLEIGGFLSKFGTKVTVLEAGENLFGGIVDKEAVQVVARRLKKNGVEIHTGAKAKGYKKSGDGVEVTYEVGGKEQKISADKVLVTVGRKPNSDQLNLKGIGIQLDERGFVKINPQCKTSIPGIYAIGDIAGQPMLAHKASHEGVLVAEVISGQNRVYDAKTVPAVIFTDPEIASVGLTEEECKAKGKTDLKIGKFPFGANGRAVSLMETDGFVKYIADAKTNVILGVHVVGPEASNLISEAALAIEMGATLEDIALTIHPHPTLGETMMEAAEAALGHAIHIIQKPLSSAKPSRPSARA
ncbi:MAG: dihydrolipoyl dehydrogenase [Bdellovibrionales bacterium]|nr:dihydrolipoyl dehydrogenase [Bdellovibrionales bacterium]